MVIRSYRSAFALERRIYRVDRLRLNPAGVPVRGVVYFGAMLAAVLALARLPLLEAVARSTPWYLRCVALPGASAAVLTLIRIDGRPFHLAARSLVRFGLRPRRLAGLRACRPSGCSPPHGRWHPDAIVFLPDGSDSRLRRLSYTGPGAVLVAVAHRRELSRAGRRGVLSRRKPHLLLREGAIAAGQGACASGQVIVLERSVRMRVL